MTKNLLIRDLNKGQIISWDPVNRSMLTIEGGGDFVVTDGHHTMDELYEWRAALTATMVNLNNASDQPILFAGKSRKHHNGEYPFGDENWFIIWFDTPEGKVTNHYHLDKWDWFDIPEYPVAPEWDGHDAKEALRRIKALNDIPVDVNGGDDDK